MSARARRLLVATGNPHKVEELAAILPGWEIATQDPVDETGVTFEENALIKARALAVASGELAVADDSGIEIDALGGRPGIHSKRWTDEGDWIPRVLRELQELGQGTTRTCRYVCAAAAVTPGGREIVVRGTVEGQVAASPRGSGGFGYDAIFVPDDGDGRTFAEMTDTEKHTMSHRGRAFRALAPHL